MTKDPSRSKPNSTLLDARLASMSLPSSPEIQLNDDPVPETQLFQELRRASPIIGLPNTLLCQTEWIMLFTWIKISRLLRDEDNVHCRLCGQTFSSYRHLKVLISQHSITTFCPRGEFLYNHKYVLRQQRTMGCHVGHLFSVDGASFQDFFAVICPLF